MIAIKKTIEITYYLKESDIKAFADRNGFDEDEIYEAIDNDELDVEGLCFSQSEELVDYEVERNLKHVLF